MTNNQEEILRRAILEYGIDNQLNQAIEEMAELIQAINKARRAGIVANWGIKPPSQESQMNEVETYHDLCREVADVKIMLAQIEMMLQPDFVSISFERKINRLKTRLDVQQKA